MEPLHLANLYVHIGAGIAGIAVGIAILARAKGTRWHRRIGRAFAACALIVGATATIGSIAFRFIPLFAVLTVLTLYQLVSGWRAVRNKGAGPQLFDGAWTLAAIAATLLLLPVLGIAPTHDSKPVVVISTLAALALILAYDALRWLFPRRWFAALWPYEHVYKLMSAFAALLSAFAGNVLPAAQPWSQVAPSALGSLLIVWYFVRIAQQRDAWARTTP